MNQGQNRQDILSVNEPKFFINDNNISSNKIVEMSTTEQPCLNYENEYGNTQDFSGAVRKYRKAQKRGRHQHNV